MNNPAITLVSLIAFAVTLTFHEFSHALAGYLLGDDTAKRFGRLTLNPIPHIDPLGTVVLPLLGAFTGLPVIGWAKPVPFNPYNLKYGKWGAVLVALAGPLANLVVATVSVILLIILTGPVGMSPYNLLAVFLVLLALISLVLAAFNLLPINPLDGSRLVSALLDAPKYRNVRIFLETKGPLILMLIILLDFMGPVSFLDRLFSFIVTGFFWIFGAVPLLLAVFSVM